MERITIHRDIDIWTWAGPKHSVHVAQNRWKWKRLQAHWPLALVDGFPALWLCATGSPTRGVPQGPFRKN